MRTLLHALRRRLRRRRYRSKFDDPNEPQFNIVGTWHYNEHGELEPDQ